MPLYEYECASCKKVFEIMQKFSDPVLTACEVCGKPVKKLISQTSFQLKGGGWFASNYEKSPLKTSSNTESSAGGGETKSESTPKKSESGGSSES